METKAGTVGLDHPDTRQAFGKLKTLVATYGVLSAVVLITVAVLAITEHTATSFMWGRSAGVLASAAVTYWLSVVAARGVGGAYLLGRLISVCMPGVMLGA